MNKILTILGLLGATLSMWLHVAYERLRKRVKLLEQEKTKREMDEKAKKVSADVANSNLDDLIDRVDSRLSKEE